MNHCVAPLEKADGKFVSREPHTRVGIPRALEAALRHTQVAVLVLDPREVRHHWSTLLDRKPLQAVFVSGLFLFLGDGIGGVSHAIAALALEGVVWIVQIHLPQGE